MPEANGLLAGRLLIDGFEGQSDLDQFLAILRHFLQPFPVVLMAGASPKKYRYPVTSSHVTTIHGERFPSSPIRSASTPYTRRMYRSVSYATTSSALASSSRSA